MTRAPANTRPLSLSNTDAKIVAKAVNIPLADVAAQTVDPVQRGLVKNRLLHDNIFDLESAGAY